MNGKVFENMRIYYTGVDCGDGSISVEFFESQECIDLLEEHEPESYRGEGGRWFDVDGSISITTQITTLKEVKARIAEDEEFEE